MTTTTERRKVERDQGLLGILRRGDLGVVGMAAVLLLCGWVLRGRHLDRTVRHESDGLILEHPSGWLSSRAAGPTTIADLSAGGSFKPRIVVSAEELPGHLVPDELGSYLQLNLQRQLALFHLVSERRITVDGRAAARLDYAYALNPAVRPDDPAATDVPVVVRASSIILIAGKALRRVDVEQPLSQSRADPGLADRVLASLHVMPRQLRAASGPHGGASIAAERRASR
jgi:hypothetical protein